MSLFQPSAVISLAGKDYSAAEAALADLWVQLSLGAAHDAVSLTVWPGSKLLSAAPGDELAISVGQSGDEKEVWSGEVAAVDVRAGCTVLEGLAATVALSRERRSQTFIQQSVSDIVKDLASAVAIDEVDTGGPSFDVYSVDDRRTIWEHLQDLARLSGRDLSASADGGFRFMPPRTGGASVRLRFGAELLAWSVTSTSGPAAPAVAALGAGSEQGAERWHWLRRDPAPDAGETRTRVVAPFRTKDPADALAEALEAGSARAAVRGRATAVGQAEIRAGDLVELVDLPANDPGVLRVLAVEHRLAGDAGFHSTLQLESEGSGALGALGGLGL